MNTFPEFTRLLNQQLLRQERSATWLARRLQLHPGTVNRWLNQELRPATPELVARIADLLCIHNMAERQRFLLAAGYGYVDGHDAGGAAQPLATSALYEQIRAGDLGASGAIPDRKNRQAARVNPHNLPAQPTALIGRERDVQTVCALLTNHTGRLLTLLGPPGIGKTRLGLAVAARLHAVYQDGAYFAPLAAISDPALVASALLAAVGISDTNPKPSPKPPWTRLLEFLRDKELLLLLDNFEQITGAAPLVAELLATCPRVRILVTSRERLHLRAEQRFQVPFLEVAPAVVLFTQRAQAIAPAFAVTPENQPILTEICQRLDCLPLAIELLAARIDLFPPPIMLVRLQDHRLDLLTDGQYDLPVHHRTLRNAIHRSYHLLNEQEQRLFRTLGVFASSFDLAAVAHFGFDEVALQALLTKNLVQVTSPAAPRTTGKEGSIASPQRFLLLETLREYAREQLLAAGALAAVSEQHADYFFKLAEAAAPHLRGHAEQKSWLERLAYDHDNLRTALGWFLATDADMAQNMASQLYGFWFGIGLFTEGLSWLAKTLAVSDAPTPSRARTLLAASELAQDQGDQQKAEQFAKASLALFEALGDPAGCAGALGMLSETLSATREFSQACIYLEQSLHLARQTGQQALVACSLTDLARISIRQGMISERILADLQESATIFQSLDQPAGVAYVYQVQAKAQLLTGDYAKAVALFQEALNLSLPLGAQWDVAWDLNNLAEATWLAGDWSTASLYWQEALQFFQAADIKPGLMQVWYYLGQIARCVHQDCEQAAHYYRQSLTLCWELKDETFVARCLTGLGGVALVQSRLKRAVNLLSATQKLFDTQSAFLTPRDRDEYAKLLDDTRTQLDETTFAAAWAEGQAITLDTAVAYALDRIAS